MTFLSKGAVGAAVCIFSFDVCAMSLMILLKRRAELRKAAALRKAIEEQDATISELEEAVVDARHRQNLDALDHLHGAIDALGDKIDALGDKIENIVDRIDCQLGDLLRDK